MWAENELVVHESAGVCRITGITKMNRPQREYYVLEPLYDRNSTLYVPVDGKSSPIRPVMTREQALDLIDQLPQVQLLHFDSMNDEKQRSASILQSGDQLQLAQLAKTMRAIQGRRTRSSKTTYATDRGILRQAERLLYGELAVSLNLNVDGVEGFISQKLGASVPQA